MSFYITSIFHIYEMQTVLASFSKWRKPTTERQLKLSNSIWRSKFTLGAAASPYGNARISQKKKSIKFTQRHPIVDVWIMYDHFERPVCSGL